ncbi:Protein CBG27835 [Caenorhabditis briggsae]|uniref:Protein CBG27835 n=1 Tax=Caenorhabditis briggsae TaxID=6238 RepID=B6IKB7_CAEBR|nr:Protein CBG27835 [Caenorhabditis briggsae]CAS00347.1 Protein CBG27835 [Caenorhabditis briggsae]
MDEMLERSSLRMAMKQGPSDQKKSLMDLEGIVKHYAGEEFRPRQEIGIQGRKTEVLQTTSSSVWPGFG